MNFPRQLILRDARYYLDGGTTVLSAADETGQPHVIELTQHASPRAPDKADKLPGRLYFNGDLIALRSAAESQLLHLLSNATFLIASTESGGDPPPSDDCRIVAPSDDLHQLFSRSPAANLRALTTDLIVFIASEDSLQFASRVEQATDQTRYTVWPAWTPESRKAVAIRLGRLLSVNISAALRYLDDDSRLAEHITALEVADLAERYAAEGLSLRVEPAFPWTIPTPTSQALPQPHHVTDNNR